MTRLAYLWRLLDARDRWVLAGGLALLLVSAVGVGYVHGALDRRTAREADCTQRMKAYDAKLRQRGIVAIRLSHPCVEGEQ